MVEILSGRPIGIETIPVIPEPKTDDSVQV